MDRFDHHLIRVSQRDAWIFAVVAVCLLGIFRTYTEAKFELISAAIIPVVVVSWAGGIRHGLTVAALATAMWFVGDVKSLQDLISNGIPLVNGVTRFAVYGLIAYLTTRVSTLMRREIERATTDGLTNLMNRRTFLEAGDMEVNRSRRFGRPVAVIFLDLDNFKKLNDSRGHDIGDSALKATAEALKKSLRATDLVARLGGDEFAVILPEVDSEGASAVGDKISQEMSEAMTPFSPVSASLGIAWFQRSNADFAEMLKAADQLMYQIKADKKGGIRMHKFLDVPSG